MTTLPLAASLCKHMHKQQMGGGGVVEKSCVIRAGVQLQSVDIWERIAGSLSPIFLFSVFYSDTKDTLLTKILADL